MTMRASLRLTFALAAAGALTLSAACSPYDPNLGETPFRCGNTEPRCPDGYTCVEHDPSNQLCEKNGGGGGFADAGADADPSIDSGMFTCANDTQLESNNSTSEATITPIPDFGDNYELVNLAICPDTDEDFFRFRIDTMGKNVKADVIYQSNRGQLNLSILNSTGDSIRDGAPVPGDPDTLRAEVPNLPTGTFYVKVSAPAGIQNNYTLSIVTTGP